MFKRLATIAVAIAVFVMTFAPMALAVSESGSLGCGSNFVVVRSYAQYVVKHYWPTGTLRYTFNNVSYTVRTTNTGTHSTSWKVTADDAINNSETYAYCSPFG